MKFTHKNETFEIDIEKAKQLGLCKKIHTEIKDFMIGDVFALPNKKRLLITQGLYQGAGREYLFGIAGLSGLELYRNFDYGITKQRLLDFLNERQFRFVKNINQEIHSLINS